MKKTKNKNMKPREDRKNSPFEDRKRFCPFSQKNSPIIDYKDIKTLSRYLSEKGKITPSRITNVSSKKQKELSTAIKRARFLGLLSYTQKNI
jgi:small subunit ribosomal protein S18